MKKIARLLAAIMLTTSALLVTSALHAETREFCRNMDVPLAFDVADSQVRADDVSFVSKVDGSSAAVVVLNRASKSITRLLIVVDFLNDRDKQLVSIPLLASTRSEIQRESSPMSIAVRKELPAAVRPAELVSMFGSIQAATRKCPKRARVTLFEVGFEDGSEFRRAADEWRLGASVRRPVRLHLDNRLAALPFQAILGLTIDTAGNVTEARPQDVPGSLESWLADEVAQWSFNPGMRDGRPITSHVDVLLRVHRGTNLNDLPPVESEVSSLITVDVLLKDGRKDLQYVMLNGAPVIGP
jgi:hypothetical protein